MKHPPGRAIRKHKGRPVFPARAGQQRLEGPTWIVPLTCGHEAHLPAHGRTVAPSAGPCPTCQSGNSIRTQRELERALAAPERVELTPTQTARVRAVVQGLAKARRGGVPAVAVELGVAAHALQRLSAPGATKTTTGPVLDALAAATGTDRAGLLAGRGGFEVEHPTEGRRTWEDEPRNLPRGGAR